MTVLVPREGAPHHTLPTQKGPGLPFVSGSSSQLPQVIDLDPSCVTAKGAVMGAKREG